MMPLGIFCKIPYAILQGIEVAKFDPEQGIGIWEQGI
jgi:hypothetical protein